MSEVNTNTAETTNTEVKQPSKMDLARPIFQRVRAEDYELPEGKTARAEFIRLAQEEAGLTAKGAATYWQNLVKESKGLKMYSSAKKKDVPQTEAQTEQSATDAQGAADAQAGLAEEQEEAVA